MLADGASLKQLSKEGEHNRSVYNRIRVMKEITGAKTETELCCIAMRKGFIK